jgi:hypothetical protein
MRSRDGSFCNPLALAALTDSLSDGEGIQVSSVEFVSIPFPVVTWAWICDLLCEVSRSYFRLPRGGFRTE